MLYEVITAPFLDSRISALARLCKIFAKKLLGIQSSRITSYNVCYTKLLRMHEESLRHEEYMQASQQHHEKITKILEIVVDDKTDKNVKQELIELLNRITSYNVCYTKLLRDMLQVTLYRHCFCQLFFRNNVCFYQFFIPRGIQKHIP